MKNPKISFVIPAYNKEAYLGNAIDSCLQQSLKEIEVIVVDDGSTDHTERLMKHYTEKDDRVKYYKLPKNVGRSMARNYGNEKATADIICVQDADDISVPKRAAIVYDHFKRKPKTEMFYGGFYITDYFFNTIDQIKPKEFNYELVKETGSTYIGHSSMAYTKKVAMKYKYSANEYDDLGLDDWELQMSMYKGGVKFDYTTNPLFHYRQLTNNISHIRDSVAVYKLKGKFFEQYGEKLTIEGMEKVK